MALLRFDGVDLKDPSSMQWSLQRVSSPDAGRTLDAVMHVEQVAVKRKLELAWNNITGAEATAIIQAAEPEYIQVRYYDYLDGQYETRKFYTGDQQIPVYTHQSGKHIVSNVAFNIIEV